MTNQVKENTMYAIRHGEVFLQPISKLPKGKLTNCKEFIVGHSETGHHHVLESNTEFSVHEVDKAMLYIQLFEPATLVHKKTVNRHNDLVVPAGTYKVIHKQEYNPFTRIMERVWD